MQRNGDTKDVSNVLAKGSPCLTPRVQTKRPIISNGHLQLQSLDLTKPMYAIKPHRRAFLLIKRFELGAKSVIDQFVNQPPCHAILKDVSEDYRLSFRHFSSGTVLTSGDNTPSSSLMVKVSFRIAASSPESARAAMARRAER